jgi:hypothetical protein
VARARAEARSPPPSVHVPTASTSAVARALIDGWTSPRRATHARAEGRGVATVVGWAVADADAVAEVVAAAGADEGGAPAAVVAAVTDDEVVWPEHAASAPLARMAESTWRRVSSTPARRTARVHRSSRARVDGDPTVDSPSAVYAPRRGYRWPATWAGVSQRAFSGHRAPIALPVPRSTHE